MNRSQIIIITTGVLLVVALFKLPKVLVSDNKNSLKKEESASSNTATEEPEFKESHTATLSAKDSELITTLKKELNSFSNPGKKLIFADSIAKVFRKSGLFDSSAYYYGVKAEIEASDKNLDKAGDAYYEAFSASGASNKALNQKAQAYYKQVSDKHPDNLEAKAKLAMTYAATENPMQGIALLRDVLTKDPKNELAIYNLGILSIQSGQYDKAIKRFEDLLKINPNHANGRFYLGLALLNAGKTQNAKAEFLKAKELDSDPAFQEIVDSYLKEIKN